MDKTVEGFLENIDCRISKNDKIAYLKNSCYPIVLWGAGSLAHSVKKYITKKGIAIDACLIDSKVGIGQEFEEIPIMNLQQLEEKYDKVNVVIGHSRYDLRSVLMQKSKAINNVIYFCNVCYEQYEPISYDFIKDNAEKYKNAYHSLEDELSKKCMIGYLNSKMIDDIAYIEQCMTETKNSYFNNELFEIGEEETYLDLGAYIGDTILEFLEISQSCYKKIIAFEPEETSFTQLNDLITKKNIKDVALHKLGCYNRKTRLYFNDCEESSSITNSSSNFSIEVTDLDSLIRDEKVSMIKINYLYGVMESLEGAINVIKNNTPKIAIAVGFDAITLINVIEYFNKLNQKYGNTWEGYYKFILRYNAAMPSRLVLYAKFINWR